MAIIPGLENINFTGIAVRTAYWTGIGLFTLLMTGVVGYFIYKKSYNYNITIWPLVGSGNANYFAIGIPSKNQAKIVESGGRRYMKFFWPLLNRKEYEPFPEDLRYSGRNLYGYRMGEFILPARLHGLSKEEGLQIKPVPNYIRNWQSLSHKKLEMEFRKPGFWEENKYTIMTLMTISICMVGFIATIYFAYKLSAPGIAETSRLTEAIKSLGTIR